ncbi:hypothetical protein PBRA_002831 [Plasmodiophora brassicae]|uniref:C2 domain-containing protein n=1 Tax=Plasmodiophora brassicae TaxID=37360 RepID=A0A0G4J668_PLABS|nr:hypothetical protein PBRA_002831 [Plasmodiophora brassicae]
MLDVIDRWISRLVGGLIARYLTSFLPGFNPDDVTIHLFSGVVELRNVVVSRAVFSFLEGMIPWSFGKLRIGKVYLRLPLFNLLEDNLVVEVDNVDVEFAAEDYAKHRFVPKPESPFNPVLKYVPPESDPVGDAKDTNALTMPILRLVFAILSNVRVEVANVRACVRDTITNPSHPHAITLTVRKALLTSCDGQGVGFECACPAVYQPTLRFKLTLSTIEAFFETPKKMSGAVALIEHRDDLVATARVRLGTSADHAETCLEDEPAHFLTTDIDVKTLVLQVADEHMSFVWDLLVRLFLWMRVYQVEWLRPIEPVHDCPAKWWQFAHRVLQEELAERLAQIRATTWSRVIISAKRRRRYIRLYRKLMAKTKALTVDECITLQQLDQGFDVDCLRLYRGVAMQNLANNKSLMQRALHFIQRFSGSSGRNVFHTQVDRRSSTYLDDDGCDDDTDSEASNQKSPHEGLSGLSDPGQSVGFMAFKLLANQLHIIMTNRARPACDLLDLTFMGVGASFGMNYMGTSMSATLSIDNIFSSSAPDALRIGFDIEDENNVQWLTAQWSMDFNAVSTCMGVNARLAPSRVHLPGQFVNRLLLWLFPVSFGQAPSPNFYLVPPTLFATEIRAVQKRLMAKTLVPVFRMLIDACIEPIIILVNTGDAPGPQLRLALGCVTAKCCDAKSDEVDMSRFPEFSHGATIANGVSAYDMMTLKIDHVGLSFLDTGDSPRSLPRSNQVLKLVSDAPSAMVGMSTTEATAVARPSNPLGSSGSIEAAVLMLTTYHQLPWLLVEAGLPPVRLSISDRFYRVLFQILDTFFPPPSDEIAMANAAAVEDHRNVNSMFATEEVLPAPSYSLAGWSGSRFTFKAMGVEVVIIDRFTLTEASVLRVRVQGLRLHSLVKSDTNRMVSSIKTETEAWYLNHTVHAWEPLLEPWALALTHRWDGFSANEIELHGDTRTLNITFSSACAETLVHVAQSYGFLTPPKVESQSAHNVISNQTGDAIRIVSNDGSVDMTVPSEKEVPLPRAAVGSHLKFQITLPDGSALSGVELLQGTRVANQNAVSAVTTNFGFTMLRVHSRTIFENSTGHDLDVAFEGLEDMSSFFKSRIVKPGAKEYLPLAVALKGKVMVRLRGRGMGFSSPIEVTPSSRTSSGSFDLILKPEKSDDQSTAVTSPSSRVGAKFAIESSGRSLRLTGHQRLEDDILVISVTPVAVVENLLYSSCDVRFSGDGMNDQTVKDVQCGNRVECFLNHPNIRVSIALPGRDFSKPFDIVESGPTGIAHLFNKDSREKYAIGIPSARSTSGRFTNYIAFEAECLSGHCIHVRVFAPFWIVNHYPEPIYVKFAEDDDHRDNVVPTYPTTSNHGVPMLMSGCVDSASAAICVATATSKFSDRIQIGKLETGITKEIMDEKGELELRIKMNRAGGLFHRTKIVTAMPQLVIVNCLSRPLYLRQNAHETQWEVPANDRLLRFAWPEPDQPRIVRVAFSPDDPGGWSGLVSFIVLGEYRLTVPLKTDENSPASVEIVECIVKQRESIVFAVFRQGDMRFPPCQVQNNSVMPLEVSQFAANSWTPVPPFTSIPFCWLEPLSELALEVRLEGSGDAPVLVDMDSEEPVASKWKTSKCSFLVESIRFDGPTKTLRLTELDSTSTDQSPASRQHFLSGLAIAAAIDRQSTMLESLVKFADKQYQKDIYALDSLRTHPSKVFIEVVEAWDLPKTDVRGSIDPFFEISAGDVRDRTDTRKNEQNPHFRHKTVVPIRDGVSHIQFRLLDYNVVKNEVVSGFDIPLTLLPNEFEIHRWFKLFKIKDKEVSAIRHQGQVRVIMQWVKTPETMKQRLRDDLDRKTQYYQQQLKSLAEQKSKITAELEAADRRESTLVMSCTTQSIRDVLAKRSGAESQAVKRAEKSKIVSGKFKIGILSAKNCLAMDNGVSSDPYCKLSYAETGFQTKVIKKTLNPDWDETFEFDYQSLPSTQGYVVRIAVFDQDQTSEDDFMGECVVAVDDYIDLPVKQQIQEWHSLLSLNPDADELFQVELGDSAGSRGDLLVQFEWVEKKVEGYLYDIDAKVVLPSFGISVVDSGCHRELMFLSAQKINLEYQLVNNWRDFSLSVSIETVQIDNPDLNSGGGDSSHMVMLHSDRKAADGPQPMIQLAIVSEHLSDLFDYYPFVNVLVQGITVRANTYWLSSMLWLLQYLVDLLFAGYEDPKPPTLPVVTVPIILFGVMVLSPLSLTVSFRKGVAMSGITERQTDFDWILKIASSVSLDSAPVRLNALGLSHYLASYEDLYTLVFSHYLKSAMAAAFGILGSTEVLGNPVQLVTGLGSGVKDFFFEPAAGLAQGPAAFGRGILKGSASLFSGTVGGVFNSASIVTGNLGKIAAAATFDDEYRTKLKQQQMQLNSADTTGLTAIKTGGAAFGRGILSGVTGVFVDPIKGAKREGAKGFVKGFGKGIVGVVAKPISGTLQLASAAAGGVRSVASSYNKFNHKRPMLVRFPRTFYGNQGRIKLYTATRAKGSFFLDTVHDAKYRGDVLIDILDLADCRTLILTNSRLLMVAMDANEAIFHVLALSDEWSVDLSTLSFNVADNRLQLCDTQRSKTWNVDLTQIPSRNRETFVGKLAEAVRQVKNGQQGHPVDHDSDKEHPQWPSSPSFDRPGGHPQVPRPLRPTPEASLTAQPVELLETNKQIENLEVDIDRLKTDMSSASHSGLSLEVVVHSASQLTTKARKLKPFCKVWVQTRPNATVLKRQASLDPDGSDEKAQETRYVSQTTESRHPVWNFYSQFPLVDEVDSLQLAVKVMSKRIGIAKVLGEAVYDLDQLAIDIPVSVQLTLYKAKSPDTPRGVIDVTIRLFNPSLVALAARMDVAKHKMLTQLKTKVGIIRHLQRNVRNRSQSPVPLDLVERDGSTVSSDIERSEFTDDEDYENNVGSVTSALEEQVESSLRRQFRFLNDKSYLREATLRDVNARVQFEIVQGRRFAKAKTRRKAPPLFVTASVGERKFRSLQNESWDPLWRLKFAVPMPRSSVPIQIRVRYKQFIGAKHVGTLSMDFASLLEKASDEDGAWIPMYKSGTPSPTDEVACEVLVRIQVQSPVLDGLIAAENEVATELMMRPSQHNIATQSRT